VLHARRGQDRARRGCFFQTIKVLLTKKEISSRKRTDDERDLAVGQINGSALVSNEVVEIFNAAGLEKPNVGILDDDFLNEVRNLFERNLAVELLERLLEGEIKSRFATNVVQNNRFSEMLINVIKRYQNRSIETAQVMEELIAMAKKFKKEAKRGANAGLNANELASHDALAGNQESVRELGDETLKEIAHELVESLRKNVSVD
jgi:type I restriction enzyme R subunit